MAFLLLTRSGSWHLLTYTYRGSEFIVPHEDAMTPSLLSQATPKVAAARPPRLLDTVAPAARQRGASVPTTAQLDCSVHAYVLFHTEQHPRELDLAAFLVMRSPDILILMRMASDIATFTFYTGLDPFNGQELHGGVPMRDRKLHRVLVQFFERTSNATAGPLQPASEPNAPVA